VCDRFISVSDRFIQDLVKINTGTLAKDEEARAEHLIRGMRYLNFKIYPLEQFEEAAEFLEALADVFEAANGARVKLAMASTLTALLEPIIAVRVLLLRVTCLRETGRQRQRK
jgi:hypothetical protein